MTAVPLDSHRFGSSARHGGIADAVALARRLLQISFDAPLGG
jgi:hypothetical protein